MSKQSSIHLLNEVTCPNCWKKFSPESLLAISGHSELQGDPRLEASQEGRRFLPTRFTPDCAALDIKDIATFELACPHCHLVVPRVILERSDTIFLSLFGRTSAGKSFYLASLAQQLQTAFPQRFGLAATEPHPPSNKLIREYRNAVFHTPDPNALVTIPATNPTGNKHYQGVRIPGDVLNYPRPIFYQLSPTGTHPKARSQKKHARTLCLYDNAGEHFTPEWASSIQPETEHLSRSSAMLFIFDVTQETGFIEHARKTSSTSQFGLIPVENRLDPQDVILTTANHNVKKWLGHELSDPLDKPLIVILSKFDEWKHHFADELPSLSRSSSHDASNIHGFRADVVKSVSNKMRKLLLKYSPSIVAAAEEFSNQVSYIPVSATGCEPENQNGSKMFRRGSLRPTWVEAPLLWALHRLTKGLVTDVSPGTTHAG